MRGVGFLKVGPGCSFTALQSYTPSCCSVAAAEITLPQFSSAATVDSQSLHKSGHTTPVKPPTTTKYCAPEEYSCKCHEISLTTYTGGNQVLSRRCLGQRTHPAVQEDSRDFNECPKLGVHARRDPKGPAPRQRHSPSIRPGRSQDAKRVYLARRPCKTRPNYPGLGR